MPSAPQSRLSSFTFDDGPDSTHTDEILDVLKANDAHATFLGRFGPVRWVRPGSSWYNARMIATIQRAGYRCALGSVYPYDPQLRSAPIASAYILANVQPGAVVVLHERDARGPRTVATLKRVLPVVRSRGYRIVTLSELARLQRS